MANSKSWNKIMNDKKWQSYDFNKSPLFITANEIKKSCQNFKTTGEKEPRILCYQTTRESKPNIFKENNLFILSKKRGEYLILKGDGYVDIPDIITKPEIYNPKIDFEFDTFKIGNSEMQHLDYAYSVSIIRTFMNDSSLCLTIRGRKQTSNFSFNVNKHKIDVSSATFEVDAGYEGKDKIVLVEAKNSSTKNTLIRQIYYPFREWKKIAKKTYTHYFLKKEKMVFLEYENLDLKTKMNIIL